MSRSSTVCLRRSPLLSFCVSFRPLIVLPGVYTGSIHRLKLRGGENILSPRYIFIGGNGPLAPPPGSTPLHVYAIVNKASQYPALPSPTRMLIVVNWPVNWSPESSAALALLVVRRHLANRTRTQFCELGPKNWLPGQRPLRDRKTTN